MMGSIISKNSDEELVKNFTAQAPRFASIKDDIRMFPKTTEALLALGDGVEYPEIGWEHSQSAEWMKKFGPIFASVMGGWSGEVPEEVNRAIEKKDVVHKGVDIRIIKKKGLKVGNVPTIMYMHGGCFAMWSVKDPAYDNYLSRLAALGQCVLVCIDFVSAAVKPYPAGLEECLLATKETIAGRMPGINAGKVFLAGDSAGANLSLAIAMTAKKEEWISDITGIYCICPYYDGVIKDAKYPSTVELDGYFASSGFLTAVITNIVEKKDREEWLKNPLLWPMQAATEDLEGLPPTKNVVMQLDMIRDIGIAFHYKLLRAGVEASLQIASGGVHEQQLFTLHSPEATEASIHDLAMFANYCAKK